MGTRGNRVATVAMVAGVLVGTSALGYGVAMAATGQGLHLADVLDETPAASPSPSPARSGAAAGAVTRSTPTVTPRATTTPTRPRSSEQAHPAPLPVERPRQVPPPGPRILGPGDDSPEVRALQSRLRQIAWYYGDVTDRYGPQTEEAVRGFQDKRGIAVTGYVDQRTMDRLLGMTREPTKDELANRMPGSTDTDAALDPRCTTGRVLCIDKSSQTLRWVVGGKVRQTMSVRFGAQYTPTREGVFHVGWKSRDHVSRLYDSPMPFAMFFSGGQAVHYSSDFAARGYAGASHGCVNVRDYDGIAALFDQVTVGDKVVVYWS